MNPAEVVGRNEKQDQYQRQADPDLQRAQHFWRVGIFTPQVIKTRAKAEHDRRKQNQDYEFHNSILSSRQYNVNEDDKTPLPAWLPLIVGAAFVLLFVSLGTWQVNRGLEKRAAREAFSQESGFSAWQDGMQIRPYQRLKVTGAYTGDRQLLLENIIVNSRNGYYVITPLVSREHEPALLVNRGWIEQPADADTLAVPDCRITVRGRAGSLPRAGYKMGEAFSSASGWPKRAVYPSLDEVAVALGRSVQPFVLLLDEQEQHGFYRQWTPSGFGPGKHFGYAVQWFAMGAVLSGLLLWNYRKKRF